MRRSRATEQREIIRQVRDRIKAAAVQDSSFAFDLQHGITKLKELVQRAAQEVVDLVSFPSAFAGIFALPASYLSTCNTA